VKPIGASYAGLLALFAAATEDHRDGMSNEPQDSAESFDEDMTGADPDASDRADPAPDVPYLVDEELVSEPIVDSVESREARLEPEDDASLAPAADDRDVELMEADLSELLASDELGVIADDGELSAEEAAIHVIDTGD